MHLLLRDRRAILFGAIKLNCTVAFRTYAWPSFVCARRGARHRC